MHIEIDKNNNINFLNKNNLLFQEKEQIYIFGEFIGIYNQKKFLKKDEALNLLKDNIKKNNNINYLISNIIGNCSILLKKVSGDIKIYNSLESSGFFYTKTESKIYITSKELEICKFLKDKNLDEYEIISFIYRHNNKKNSFTSIFENSKRLPSGFYLEIEKNFKTKSETFLNIEEFNKDNRKPKEIDKEFKFLLEGIIKFYLENKKYQKVYSTISGGIDSTAVSIAVKNVNKNVQLLHHTKYDDLEKYIDILALKIKLPVKKIFGNFKKSEKDYWSEYENDNEFIKNYLAPLHIENTLLTKTYKNENLITLGGASLGQLYQIFPSIKPIFNMNKLARSIFYIKDGIFVRLISTKFYIKFMDNFLFNFLFKTLINKNFKIPSNQYEYLSFLAIDAVRPIMPSKNEFGKLSNTIYQDFINRDSEFYLSKILSQEDYNSIKIKKKLSATKLQNYARLISFARGIDVMKFSNNNCENHYKFRQIEPGWTGPLSIFLLNLPIGLHATLKPKDLYFRYFSNELKWDYFRNFIKKTQTHNNSILQTLFFFKNIYMRTISKNKKKNRDIYDDQLINSKEFKNRYSNFLNEKKSILLKKIRNNEIRQWLKEVFYDVNKGKNVDYLQSLQLINLEAFLREFYK